MKNFILAIAIFSFSINNIFSQSIKERDLVGSTFELVIDIDQDAIEADLDDASFFAEMIGDAVLNLVDNVLEGIDITLEFKRNHEVIIEVEAFGTHEINYSTWQIEDGYLFIEDENENHHFKSDDKWVKKGDRIVSVDENEHVFLKKISK